MTLEQELAAAYENLTSTQKRCTELLEEKRALLARAAVFEKDTSEFLERSSTDRMAAQARTAKLETLARELVATWPKCFECTAPAVCNNIHYRFCDKHRIENCGDHEWSAPLRALVAALEGGDHE